MRTVGVNTVNYLNARQGVVSRQLIWFEAKNRTTGAVETVGFSNLAYNVSISVVDGNGATVIRDYVGAGTLIDVSEINLVSDLTIQTVRVNLSQSSETVNNAIRGYDMRNAKCEIHYPLFDLNTRNVIDPPTPHFVGRVNKLSIKRGKVGSASPVSIELHSRIRDLTLTNSAVKSNAFQQSRYPGDNFRKYGDVVGLWPVWWGEEKKPVVSNG